MKKNNYYFIPLTTFSLLLASSVLATPKVDPTEKKYAKSNYFLPPDLQSNAPVTNQLHEAMALYYNRQYRLALPLLKAIAVTNDSTEVLFWLGRSAFETGQTNLSIEKYQQILAREPKLSRVRLELAAAYMKTGDKAAADAELSKILAENPDTGLKQQIEQTRLGLGQPVEEGKRFSAAIRASIGPEYDSNINVSPRAEVIPLPNSQQITTKKLDGWLVKMNVNAESLYDFGSPNGFAWHNRLQFLHNEYPDPTNSNFNYTQTDVNTGLDYYDPQFKIKAPIGFIDRRFSNQPLSRSYYFMPNLEIKVLSWLDFALSYRFENEDFIGTQYIALGGVSHTGTFGPRLKFEALDAQHSLALFGAYSRRDANSATWSFNEWSVGPSYFAHFKTGTELYLDFKYLNRNYDAPATLFVAQGDRLDNRYAVTFSLSQTFKKYFYVSLNYNYTDNSSNAQLFTYNKNMIGLNFGTNLSF